jgi:hypothetical protein
MPTSVFSEWDLGERNAIAMVTQIANSKNVDCLVEISQGDEDRPTGTYVIWLHGERNSQVEEALRGIMDGLKPRQGHRDVWRPTFLVTPPSTLNTNFHAKRLTASGISARLVSLSSQRSSLETHTVETSVTRSLYLKQMSGRLTEILSYFRRVPSNLCMRVQFGTLLLDQYPTNVSSLSFEALQNSVALVGRRGTTRFDTK